MKGIMKELNNRWADEKKKDKAIRKDCKGMFLLWHGNQKKIAPYFMIKEFANLYYYGSMGLKNKRELTKEEHKVYFKLLNKQKKAHNNIQEFKQNLKEELNK